MLYRFLPSKIEFTATIRYSTVQYCTLSYSNNNEAQSTTELDPVQLCNLQVEKGLGFQDDDRVTHVTRPATEVNSVASVAEFPFELEGRVVHAALELNPSGVIGSRVSGSPEAKYIINESPIEKKVVRECVQESLFVECIVDDGIGWGWWCPHSGATKLFQMCITKLEDIHCHDKAECFHKGLDRNVRVFGSTKVLANKHKGTVGWYVGVHRDSVGRGFVHQLLLSSGKGKGVSSSVSFKFFHDCSCYWRVQVSGC